MRPYTLPAASTLFGAVALLVVAPGEQRFVVAVIAAMMVVQALVTGVVWERERWCRRRQRHVPFHELQTRRNAEGLTDVDGNEP